MSKTFTTGEKIIAGQTFTVVTLQQATKSGRRWVRMFCVDDIHIAQQSQGAPLCEHCGKLLFPNPQKCDHGVYSPTDRKACTLCRSPFAEQNKVTAQMRKHSTSPAQRIKRCKSKYDEDKYSGVLIDSNDCAVPRRKPESKSKTDVRKAAAEEIATLSQTFGYDGSGNGPVGFFVGVLRGTKLVKARKKAPYWVMDAALLREFASTQMDSKRATFMLYVFYVAGQTDAHIAHHLGGSQSQSAVTKYRQRLKQSGNAYFSKLKAA